MSNTQIDMLSGTSAAIVSNFISHPLDTVKVRLQLADAQHIKIWPTIKCIYRYEGIQGFFKGVMSPIASRAPIGAILFAGQGHAHRFLG